MLKMFGNGFIVYSVYFMYLGYFGQWEESGCDQGYLMLGMLLGGDLLEMVWNQGDDFYGMYNNCFFVVVEYVVCFNLLDENGKIYFMFYVCEQDLFQLYMNLWMQVNQLFQYGCNVWELIYNYYVNCMGLVVFNVLCIVKLVELKYGGSSDDVMWLMLIYCCVDYVGFMKLLFGFMVNLCGNCVVLLWWGSVGVILYVVKCVSQVNGFFNLLGMVLVSELLIYIDILFNGVWFYQIIVQGVGVLGVGFNVVCIVVFGELCLLLLLNDLNGIGMVGVLFIFVGIMILVQGMLLDGVIWGDGCVSDKVIVFDGQKVGL